MNYRVTIDIEEIDHETDRGVNIDSHQVVMLSDHEQAMKIWNWVIDTIEVQVKAATDDYRLFG
jgi:hypothetical protein